MEPRPVWRCAFQDGVLATVIALFVSFGASLATGRLFPANAAADKIMELTPPGVAVHLISLLGIAAKPFALAGALALLAVIGGVGGIAARLSASARPARPGSGASPRTAASIIGAVLAAAAQAVVLVVFFPGIGVHAALLMVALWMVVLLAIRYRLPGSEGRRWFLRRGLQAFGGLVMLSTAATWTLAAKVITGAHPGRQLFGFEPPMPREPSFAEISGLSAEATPVSSFYVLSKTVEAPVVSADSWRLKVGGLVQRPFQLSYDELLGLPRVDQWMTLRCVSNPVGGPLIGNAYWSGVPLRQLLDRAGLQPGVSAVVLKAHDTYSDSFPVERAMLDHTIVAYAMNGELLSHNHGFPARVLVPGLYGFKNIKWLEEVELIAGEYAGPWQRLGWTKTATQTTFSRIDIVRRTGERSVAAGIAFAGDRGIGAVELRVNDGQWVAGQLNIPPLSTLSWVQWRHEFQASGQTTVTTRATDATGAVQEETQRGIYPDGATGWHSVSVEL